MNQLVVSEVQSPADLGLAVYDKVQELTQGKARRAAAILSEITCLELDGRNLTASPWCMLVLFSLSDLAIHAPGVTLKICDWGVHYHTMARCSGEANAEEMASALAWAGCARQNVELEHAAIAVVRPVTMARASYQLPLSHSATIKMTANQSS